MTLRDWCSHTNNVIYGYTVVNIYQENDPPIRLVAGCTPDKIVSKQVQFVAVKKIGDKTVVFDEVEAVLEG